MRLPRPTAIIAAFLIISFSSPPSLFSQTAPKPSRPKQPAPRQSHPKRPQRAGALAAAINELLKLDPLLPKSPDSDSPDTSERKEKPRSEEHTSELQSRENLVCRLLLEKKKKKQ